MSQRARLQVNLTVEEAGVPVASVQLDRSWASSFIKREVVSLPASTFTVLNPPTGAALAVVDLSEAGESLKLKGVTGDTGVALSPSSNALGLPLVVPVSSPSIGILNSDTDAHHAVVTWVGAGTTVYPD